MFFMSTNNKQYAAFSSTVFFAIHKHDINVEHGKFLNFFLLIISCICAELISYFCIVLLQIYATVVDFAAMLKILS